MRKIFLFLILINMGSLLAASRLDLDYTLNGKEYTTNSSLALMYLERAKKYQADGDTDAANADFEKAFKVDPKLAGNFKDLHVTANGKKTMESVSPAEAINWMKKAKSCLFIPEKITCYKKAIKMDPKCFDAYYYMAKAYYSEKHYRDAKASLEELLSMEPNYSGAGKLMKKIDKEINKTDKKVQADL